MQIDNPIGVLNSEDLHLSPGSPDLSFSFVSIISACNRQFVFPFGPGFCLLFFFFFFV